MRGSDSSPSEQILTEALAASPSLCSSCVTVSSILHRPLNHTLREYLRVTTFIAWTIYSRRLPPPLRPRPRVLFRQTTRVPLEFRVAPRTQAPIARPTRAQFPYLSCGCRRGRRCSNSHRRPMFSEDTSGSRPLSRQTSLFCSYQIHTHSYCEQNVHLYCAVCVVCVS